MNRRDRARRVRTLLRVAGIRERMAQADISRAEQTHRDAQAAREASLERLAEAAAEPVTSVASLDGRRQRVDLRIDAAVAAGATVDASAEILAAARARWQAAARQRRSMEELDRRERSVQAVLATRAAERAMDDALRARRSPPAGEQRPS